MYSLCPSVYTGIRGYHELREQVEKVARHLYADSDSARHHQIERTENARAVKRKQKHGSGAFSKARRVCGTGEVKMETLKLVESSSTMQLCGGVLLIHEKEIYIREHKKVKHNGD